MPTQCHACPHGSFTRFLHPAQVGIYAGTDLAARLTSGWLPVGKYTPLSVASMRQRGYEVQVMPLYSTVSAYGAANVFPKLPTPDTTAFQLVLNVRLLFGPRLDA